MDAAHIRNLNPALNLKSERYRITAMRVKKRKFACERQNGRILTLPP